MSYFVSEPDKGIYNGMNKGVAQANGEYCLFLNSGDYFSSSKSLSRLSSQEWKGDIIAFDMFMGEGINSSIANAPQSASVLRFLSGNLSYQGVLIKTSLLKASGYDENYRIVADWAFMFDTLVFKGGTYQCINIPITVFDITGISSKPNPRHREERRMFEKHFFSPDVLEKVIKSISVEETIKEAYMSTAERKTLLAFKKIADLFFEKIYNRISIRYLNLRYREW